MTCFSACLRDLESMGVSARGSGADGACEAAD